MAKISLADFDHPLVFLFVVWMGMIALTAIASWTFASLGWSGPLGLVKGGAAQ